MLKTNLERLLAATCCALLVIIGCSMQGTAAKSHSLGVAEAKATKLEKMFDALMPTLSAKQVDAALEVLKGK